MSSLLAAVPGFYNEFVGVPLSGDGWFVKVAPAGVRAVH